MNKLFAMMVLSILAGCASAPAQPEYARYAECMLPVIRDAGLGVHVPGCAWWSFGPSKVQAAAANARADVTGK